MKPIYNPVTGKYYTLLHRNPPKREKGFSSSGFVVFARAGLLYDLVFGGEK